MNDGEISGNTASAASATGSSSSYGGGVYVGGGTFIKKGGTIYGDTDAVAGNGNETDNTAISGSGHAVGLPTPAKRRNVTAGSLVKLYAEYTGTTWTYDGTGVEGIYEDTSVNWEE
jgi:hypothetical protein